MQKDIFKQTTMLEAVSFVTALRDVVGGIAVIKMLHETSLVEWNNSVEAGTENHLIKGIFQSTKKGDAIKIYVAKIVTQYMKSVGVRLNTWTKNTVASENQTNQAIVNRIAATEFQTNEELFKLVVTRLMGFDDDIVDAALTDVGRGYANLVVKYLGSKYELFDEQADFITIYTDAIDFVEKKLSEGGFNNDYFEKAITNIITYYQWTVKDGENYIRDYWDLLAMFETE